MLMNGWWIWCGNPVGASETNDIGLANRELAQLKSLFEFRDLMIADRAFISLKRSLPLISGWKSTRTKEVEEWQQQENREISNQRGNSDGAYFRFL